MRGLYILISFGVLLVLAGKIGAVTQPASSQMANPPSASSQMANPQSATPQTSTTQPATQQTSTPTIALSVRASSQTVAPGQTVQINISAGFTGTGTPATVADDQISITYEATAGVLRAMSASANPVSLVWTSPNNPGTYPIFVTATGSKRTDIPAHAVLTLAVMRTGADLVPTLRVSANPQTIRLDQQYSATLIAQLFGTGVANKNIRFFASRGTLSATQATTDKNGLATVTLAVTAFDIGTCQVAAYSNSTTATTTVQITRSGRPTPLPYPRPFDIVIPSANSPGVLVDVNPPAIPADGQSTSLVTVRITDLRGIGLPGLPVAFTTTLGNIAPPLAMTDIWGYARVQLVAAPAAGTALITVTAGPLLGYAEVAFTASTNTAGGPPSVFLTVDPTTLPADGASRANVEALALDSDGHALVNTAVAFSVTLGSLQQTMVNTDANGRADTVLVAPTTTGAAIVTAQLGQIAASSQVTFEGPPSTAGLPGLDLRLWSGQQTEFVNRRLIYRTVQVEGKTRNSLMQSLQALGAGGIVTREIPLSSGSILIHDQYGAARGYTQEQDGQGQLTILDANGAPLRTVTVKLSLGCHLVDAQYVEPAGNLLVAISQPDGSQPEVQYLSPAGNSVLTLRDGLKALPVTALDAAGLLVVALPGGTVRLYSGEGTQVAEARRKDGLPATVAAIGPGGQWFAVASALKGQTEIHPQVSVFSGQGTLQATFDVEPVNLAPAGPDALVASTADRTILLNLATRRIDWSLVGGCQRFLAVRDYGILAGFQDPTTGAFISRVVVVHLQDGEAFAAQDFIDMRGVHALLPPDNNGYLGLIAQTFVLRFPLPVVK